MGAKDVENRNRAWYDTGKLYIHASKTEDTDEVDKVVRRVARHLGISPEEALARYQRQGRGAIIGSVHMVGCVLSYESKWFDGPPQSPLRRKKRYGYLFRDAKQFKRPRLARGFPAIPFKFRP